jgi:hypothetical protein
LLLLEAILETPGLFPRLAEVLRTKDPERGLESRNQGSAARVNSQRIGEQKDQKKGRGEKAGARR